MNMLIYSSPSKQDIVLENILQDLTNNVIQAVDVKKRQKAVPSYMIKHADHLDHNPGILNGYLERNDLANYSKSCARHLIRFNTIKSGVQH